MGTVILTATSVFSSNLTLLESPLTSNTLMTFKSLATAIASNGVYSSSERPRRDGMYSATPTLF